jgi:hypothetical protein
MQLGFGQSVAGARVMALPTDVNEVSVGRWLRRLQGAGLRRTQLAWLW